MPQHWTSDSVNFRPAGPPGPGATPSVSGAPAPTDVAQQLLSTAAALLGQQATPSTAAQPGSAFTQTAPVPPPPGWGGEAGAPALQLPHPHHAPPPALAAAAGLEGAGPGTEPAPEVPPAADIRRKTGIGSLALGPPPRDEDSDSEFDEEDTPLVLEDDEDGSNASFTAALRNIPALNVSGIELSKAEVFKRQREQAKFAKLRMEDERENLPASQATALSSPAAPEKRAGRSRGIEAARALKNALKVQSQLAGSRRSALAEAGAGTGAGAGAPNPPAEAPAGALEPEAGPSEEQRRKAKALLGAVSKARALGARAASRMGGSQELPRDPQQEYSAATDQPYGGAGTSHDSGSGSGSGSGSRSSRAGSREPSPVGGDPSPPVSLAEPTSVGEAMAQAARERKERSRKSLEKKAERRNVSVQDFSELFSFCRHGKYKHANELLKRGVPPDGRDKFGNTPLIIGCQNGHARIIKACLRHSADIDAANRQGNTGLHYCIAYGFNALGDYLISKGANDKVRNKIGLTCYEGIK